MGPSRTYSRDRQYYRLFAIGGGTPPEIVALPARGVRRPDLNDRTLARILTPIIFSIP